MDNLNLSVLIKLFMLLLLSMSVNSSLPGKCDQTPPHATILIPSENKGVYRLSILTKGMRNDIYMPAQTYVLMLTSNNQTHPFRYFMITVEDPDLDNSTLEVDTRSIDVGSLKTLDTNRLSRYSERCYNTVENTDNSDKNRVEIHWVSPKQTEKKKRVRLRATIAENEEMWYTGENLTFILDQDDRRPIDSSPYPPNDTCSLCSEARYEVIFKGRWSRLTHPRNYPSKPDDNGYSHMIGASHAFKFVLWQRGDKAGRGLKKLAEEADISVIEREIIDAMSEKEGTRTLIRGKRRHHPNMFEPSHSLFRVDRFHHLFSVLVAMKPSPDWFLGTARFELCTDLGWLDHFDMPLYPWDAGTMDGISYEPENFHYSTSPLIRIYLYRHSWQADWRSQWRTEDVNRLATYLMGQLVTGESWAYAYVYPFEEYRREATFYPIDLDGGQCHIKSVTSVTQPVDTVDRVAVGSFDKESPFYQMNLNDLKPFGYLQVRRLDVYNLNYDCSEDSEGADAGVKVAMEGTENEEKPEDQPVIAEAKENLNDDSCVLSDWSGWSECVPDSGACGVGTQVRYRYKEDKQLYYDSYKNADYLKRKITKSCQEEQDATMVQSQYCFVEC